MHGLESMKALAALVVCLVTFAGQLLASPPVALAASGDLDPSFGDGGKVVTDLGWGGLIARANDVVVDQDSGRIYGIGTDVGSTGSEILDPPFVGSSEPVPVVAAYSEAGSLLWKKGFQQRPIPCPDPVVPSCANSTYGNAALIHPVDGSLVVAGFDYAAGCAGLSCLSLYVMRVSPDGNLITPQMGQVLNGPWQRTIAAESCCVPDLNATSLAIEPDGDIIVGASLRGTDIAAGDNFALVRFLWPSGDVDTTFGTNGLLVTDFGARTDDRLQALSIQPDGKILAAGSSRSVQDPGTEDFAVIRYQPDGTVDSTFGDGGRVITDFASGADEASSIDLQQDGKIVVAGTVTALVPELNSSWPQWGVARYGADGQLDASFGEAGRSLTSFHCADPSCVPNQRASDVGIDAVGRIVLAGWAVNDPQASRKFAVARFLANGALDTSFGVDGKTTTIMQGFTDPGEATALALQPDDKVVVAGTVQTAGAVDGVPRHFGIARYLDGGDTTPACADGIDNDGDGLTDLADPGCESVADDDETDPPPVCNGLTTAEVKGPFPPTYRGLPPLARFPNDKAACEAVWVPSLDAGFVPQGLALPGDGTALVSGYIWLGDEDEESCRIMRIDLATGVTLAQRAFGRNQCRHGGGIAIDPIGRIWLADTHVLILLEGGIHSNPRPIALKGGLNGSFLIEKPWGLSIGDNDSARLYTYSYEQLDTALQRPDPQITARSRPSTSLPRRPQGGDFDGEGTLWVSSSTARCGKLSKSADSLRFGPGLGFGPGAEEIEFDFVEGSLWAVFEAGTKKYVKRPFFPLIARFSAGRIIDPENCTGF